MAEKYVLLHDIVDNHNKRIQNLKKYYPFFKLAEVSFLQYKEGKYQELDMGYITLASLRFFIDENNFNEKPVLYSEYQAFLEELLIRDFQLSVSEEEMEELTGYIFDKIKNEGKPFYFRYFDPGDHKQKAARVKLIEGEMQDGQIYYHITSDGIEFYLDTKEIKDESNISIQQLLLEKMIQANNFKGGIDVVKRMNAEVSRLSLKKREVIEILEADVYEGTKAYDGFMQHAARWFSEEEKAFSKNSELVKTAFDKAELDASNGQKEKYYQILEDIYELEVELKNTIKRHGELIRETMDLTKVVDKMVSRAKLKRLRPTFDFQIQLENLEKQDRADKMGYLVRPLLRPKIRKTFSLKSIDSLLSLKPERPEKKEYVADEREEENYRYPDEVEEHRIHENFKQMILVLFQQIKTKGRITLQELNGIYEIKFGKEIFTNGDYYTFLVHLSQKKEYEAAGMMKSQDTFLEGIVSDLFSEEEKERYEKLAFTVKVREEELMPAPGFYVSDIIFERTDLNGEKESGEGR